MVGIKKPFGPGLITHEVPCDLCEQTGSECIGSLGRGCHKCSARRTRCLYANGGVAPPRGFAKRGRGLKNLPASTRSSVPRPQEDSGAGTSQNPKKVTIKIPVRLRASQRDQSPERTRDNDSVSDLWDQTPILLRNPRPSGVGQPPEVAPVSSATARSNEDTQPRQPVVPRLPTPPRDPSPPAAPTTTSPSPMPVDQPAQRTVPNPELPTQSIAAARSSQMPLPHAPPPPLPARPAPGHIPDLSTQVQRPTPGAPSSTHSRSSTARPASTQPPPTVPNERRTSPPPPSSSSSQTRRTPPFTAPPAVHPGYQEDPRAGSALILRARTRTPADIAEDNVRQARSLLLESLETLTAVQNTVRRAEMQVQTARDALEEVRRRYGITGPAPWGR